MSTSLNFLNWYKVCCSSDYSLYRKTSYNENKAKFYYLSVKKNNYVVYPLDGSQKIVSGDRSFCEKYIENYLSTKFLIFDLKNDLPVQYFIKNEVVNII